MTQSPRISPLSWAEQMDREDVEVAHITGQSEKSTDQIGTRLKYYDNTHFKMVISVIEIKGIYADFTICFMVSF